MNRHGTNPWLILVLEEKRRVGPCGTSSADACAIASTAVPSLTLAPVVWDASGSLSARPAA